MEEHYPAGILCLVGRLLVMERHSQQDKIICPINPKFVLQINSKTSNINMFMAFDSQSLSTIFL